MNNKVNNPIIIFIGGIFPEEKYDEIINNSIGNIQFAADALQNSIIEGLSNYCKDFTIINLPFIGSWPKRYLKRLSPESYFNEKRGSYYNYSFKNIQFNNISGFKHISRYLKVKEALKSICKRNKDSDIVVLIYSVHTPFLKAAVDVKKRFTNLKIIQIAPDLPEYMSDREGSLKTLLKNINQKLLNSLYRRVDGFVVLTKYMADRLISNNQPYVVVEGIYNPLDRGVADPLQKKSDKKIIIYTGTLARRYNVMDLVEAVRFLNRDDFRLEIYGDGDTKQEIIEITEKDPRIQYGGLLSRKKILSRQQQAFLLVNPRKGNMEFTKYSFPSKTMEYLASGVPTLINRLPGIPKEYNDYCFYPESEDNIMIAKKINDILDMDVNDLENFGKKAQQFILEKKNPKVQCLKIYNLITKIIS